MLMMMFGKYVGGVEDVDDIVDIDKVQKMPEVTASDAIFGVHMLCSDLSMQMYIYVYICIYMYIPPVL